MNFINQLRESSSEDRVELIRERYEKNYRFFQEEHPEVISLIEGSQNSYHLNLTSSFLDIVHSETETLCNSNAGLDHDAILAGQYNHPDWLEMHNIRLQSDPEFPLHHIPVDYLRTEFAKSFKDIHERIVSGSVPVQNEKNGKRFSPPCIFLGIFHGLHIDYYLNENEVPSLLLIEPEAEKFEISLFFLDYSWIKDRFGTLYLVIGDDSTSLGIRNFFSIHKIHIRMWCRIFQSNPNQISHYLIEAIRRYQRAWTDLFFPLDTELFSLRNGVENIVNGLPVLSNTPNLSKNSVIVLVASGPSLDNDIEWLIENRDRILLFAVHSAVRALRAHGLKPDFQFNLDSDRDAGVVEALQLYRDIPMISDYRIGKYLLSAVDSVFLCAEKFKPTMVEFSHTLEETHPSTTNLAFSFACYCRPRMIVLLGCDFGYKSTGQTHAMHTMQSKKANSAHSPPLNSENESHVTPNFSGNGTILTNSFLTYSRLAVENCAQVYRDSVKIVNFSHGAKINGAESCHANNFIFHRYYIDRNSDVQRIRNCFTAAKEEENYRKYLISAEHLSIRFKKMLIEEMTLDCFTRKSFSQSIDTAIDNALEYCITSDNDYRMTLFSKIFTDLLSIWNCYMILSENIREAEDVYTKGLKIFRESLARIEGLSSLECLLDSGRRQNSNDTEM